jgi:hypothetical protein
MYLLLSQGAFTRLSESALVFHIFITKDENLEWNTTFFAFSSVIEGATEKVLKSIMPPNSIYNRLFGFIEQKCIFELYSSFKQEKLYQLTSFLPRKKNLLTFLELPPKCLCQYYTKMRCSIRGNLVKFDSQLI